MFGTCPVTRSGPRIATVAASAPWTGSRRTDLNRRTCLHVGGVGGVAGPSIGVRSRRPPMGVVTSYPGNNDVRVRQAGFQTAAMLSVVRSTVRGWVTPVRPAGVGYSRGGNQLVVVHAVRDWLALGNY